MRKIFRLMPAICLILSGLLSYEAANAGRAIDLVQRRLPVHQHQMEQVTDWKARQKLQEQRTDEYRAILLEKGGFRTQLAPEKTRGFWARLMEDPIFGPPAKEEREPKIPAEEPKGARRTRQGSSGIFAAPDFIEDFLQAPREKLLKAIDRDEALEKWLKEDHRLMSVIVDHDLIPNPALLKKVERLLKVTHRAYEKYLGDAEATIRDNAKELTRKTFSDELAKITDELDRAVLYQLGLESETPHPDDVPAHSAVHQLSRTQSGRKKSLPSVVERVKEWLAMTGGKPEAGTARAWRAHLLENEIFKQDTPLQAMLDDPENGERNAQRFALALFEIEHEYRDHPNDLTTPELEKLVALGLPLHREIKAPSHGWAESSIREIVRETDHGRFLLAAREWLGLDDETPSTGSDREWRQKLARALLSRFTTFPGRISDAANMKDFVLAIAEAEKMYRSNPSPLKGEFATLAALGLPLREDLEVPTSGWANQAINKLHHETEDRPWVLGANDWLKTVPAVSAQDPNYFSRADFLMRRQWRNQTEWKLDADQTDFAKTKALVLALARAEAKWLEIQREGAAVDSRQRADEMTVPVFFHDLAAAGFPLRTEDGLK